MGEVPGAESRAVTSNLIRLGANLDAQLAHADFAVLATARDPRRADSFGAEALRLQRGRSEVRGMVRYPGADRRSLADLQQGLLAELVRDDPGLTYDPEGEEKERKDALGSMGQGFLLALVAIYALLAVPFRSYSQPLIIMAAIPFGIVGAVLGHLSMGYNLSRLNLFGVVALSGVVGIDSLLPIDKTNRSVRDGAEPRQALLDEGQRRFRPILLTSLTTFFGLAPMILETSVQARFLIPMAISLGYGVLFATGITLLRIPCLGGRPAARGLPHRAGNSAGQEVANCSRALR